MVNEQTQEMSYCNTTSPIREIPPVSGPVPADWELPRRYCFGCKKLCQDHAHNEVNYFTSVRIFGLIHWPGQMACLAQFGRFTTPYLFPVPLCAQIQSAPKEAKSNYASRGRLPSALRSHWRASKAFKLSEIFKSLNLLEPPTEAQEKVVP